MEHLKLISEQLKAFLKMQYQSQRQAYRQQYAHMECFLIVYKEFKVGKFLISKAGQEWVIIDIALLPDYQNQGIGTYLIQQFLKEAALSGASVRLSVLLSNQARRLYERLGFEVIAEHQLYAIMRNNLKQQA
jgi:ribosomal protein S18 acetylase RimI-like enzyme